LPSSTKLH